MYCLEWAMGSSWWEWSVRIQIIFIEVANGFLEWHQGRIESVAGGTMVSVYPATDT